MSVSKDFFISYNKDDLKWAEWIAFQLEHANYTTVIQEWDFKAGSNFVLSMHKAAEDSKRTIAILSDAYLNANYTHPEWAAAFVKDPKGENNLLIPVRIAKCNPTGLLAAISYVDLVGLNEEEAKERLLSKIQSQSYRPSKVPFPGKGKKEQHSPAFPGIVSDQSGIKGLRPFGYEDLELFIKLERGAKLRRCVSAITHPEFRLGILSSASGNGKTSFLQAGIWPLINGNSDSHSCVYVKFTELDPRESIRLAILEQTDISEQEIYGEELTTLVANTTDSLQKTLVFLFDQFEQFFLHTPKDEDRKSFINILDEWYKKQSALSIKVLVSIRNEFVHHMLEIQSLLEINIGFQNNFRLGKFTPSQATNIFREIAATVNLEFDQQFVEVMTEEELADRKSGLISPVDIQILAWLIQGHDYTEARGFNKIVFQQLGGVDGLLENFLSRVLDPSLRQKALREVDLKVLLSLINLETNLREGTLSCDQIYERLHGVISKDKISNSLNWLARHDVRLISPSNRDNDRVYELAHERLIPALRRLTNKELSEIDKANILLDRRSQEWQGNAQNNRYLLSLKELWLIKRQKQFLQWGKRKNIKEKFLQQSWRHHSFRITASTIPVLIIFVFWLWLLTPGGQIYQSKRDLKELYPKISDSQVLEEIAVTYAVRQNFKEALEVAGQISDDYRKVSSIISIAELADSSEKDKYFNKVLELAKQSLEDSSKASAFFFA